MQKDATPVLNVLRKSLLEIVARPETNDMTVRQFCVFLSLIKGQRTVRGIAEETKLSKPAVSRAADRLAELGFAQRYEDLDDRRSVLIVMTTLGERYLANVVKA